MQIGIIGLGAMGRAMALNLVAAGHQVTAWNRSAQHLDGVTPAATPAEAFQGEVVLTMLADDAAIREALLDAGVLAQARPGLVHVVASTVSLALAEELVQRHQQAGLGYVAAPVLGRPDVAARGELNVLAAGAPEALAVAQPLLEVIGGRIWPLGPNPPAANAAKIACNMMIGMAIEALAEAVVLTEGHALPREAFFELILGTLFGSRSYQVYSAQIAAGEYNPGFKATLGLKDLRLARELAAGLGRELPMLEAVHGQMRGAVEAGLGERDWSVMAGFTLSERG
ncbi:NAD(P)-binding domain-containing protein [Pseudomonas sp. NPDC007930]|uniref:NAD(P)-dependent oxidoreductase n=1 Tax=Pseudomonas sp. NPDC007930 TaxID=3364417 RepID=UPI0036E7BEF2